HGDLRLGPPPLQVMRHRFLEPFLSEQLVDVGESDVAHLVLGATHGAQAVQVGLVNVGVVTAVAIDLFPAHLLLGQDWAEHGGGRVGVGDRIGGSQAGQVGAGGLGGGVRLGKGGAGAGGGLG